MALVLIRGIGDHPKDGDFSRDGDHPRMNTDEGDNRSWMVTVLEMQMIKATANVIRIMTLDCDHPRDCRVTSDIDIGGLNIHF